MAAYRVHYCDNAGKVFSADDVEAPDDRTVIANAKGKARSPKFEIWQRDRLVLKQPQDMAVEGDRPPRLRRIGEKRPR